MTRLHVYPPKGGRRGGIRRSRVSGARRNLSGGKEDIRMTCVLWTILSLVVGGGASIDRETLVLTKKRALLSLERAKGTVCLHTAGEKS